VSAPTPDALATTGGFSPVLERGSLMLSRRGEVALLSLSRAPANEIGRELLGELEAAWAELVRLPPRALGIASRRAEVFSAGADLRELHALSEAHRAAGGSLEEALTGVRAFLVRIGALLSAIDTAPFATIAAIEGVCMGGGFELALACDTRIADRSARFAFPELRLGLVPGWGGTARLMREAGASLLRDLLLSGRTLGARRAYELGLVQSPVARGQGLASALRLAEQIASRAPAAVAASKTLTKHLPDGALSREIETFVALFASDGVRDALARFVASKDLRPYL
jgi:enoyl-CoA hydratase/carnithine racemase